MRMNRTRQRTLRIESLEIDALFIFLLLSLRHEVQHELESVAFHERVVKTMNESGPPVVRQRWNLKLIG